MRGRATTRGREGGLRVIRHSSRPGTAPPGSHYSDSDDDDKEEDGPAEDSEDDNEEEDDPVAEVQDAAPEEGEEAAAHNPAKPARELQPEGDPEPADAGHQVVQGEDREEEGDVVAHVLAQAAAPPLAPVQLEGQVDQPQEQE